MNIKRSNFKWLLASATVGLFLANCTVKNSSDESCSKGDKKSGCECPGSLTGHQVCDADGVFGECVCPADNSGAGTSNSTAGKSSSSAGTDSNEGGTPSTTGGTKGYTAGTSSGGVAAAVGGAGAGGEGGAGGAGFPDFMDDCNTCLDALCKTELDACLADEQCFSTAGDGSGEYENVSTCIETARASGLVKRDAVRSCGLTFGASSDPDTSFPLWAPQGMAITTTNLVNCMATSSSQTPSAAWANDLATNFPNDMPAPWPADSCAKLACTGPK